MPRTSEFFEIAWKKKTGDELNLDRDLSFRLICATLAIAERFAGILKKDARVYEITIITRQIK